MDEKTGNIKQQFRAYEDLQSSHLNMLKTQEMPDLGLMTRERKRASDSLQEALNGFTDNAAFIGGQKGLTVLTMFEARLGSILKLDGTIALEVKKHRDRLKKNMSQLKKGKTAIQGYRPADPPRNKPRVISISR